MNEKTSTLNRHQKSSDTNIICRILVWKLRIQIWKAQVWKCEEQQIHLYPGVLLVLPLTQQVARTCLCLSDLGVEVTTRSCVCAAERKHRERLLLYLWELMCLLGLFRVTTSILLSFMNVLFVPSGGEKCLCCEWQRNILLYTIFALLKKLLQSCRKRENQRYYFGVPFIRKQYVFVCVPEMSWCTWILKFYKCVQMHAHTLTGISNN